MQKFFSALLIAALFSCSNADNNKNSSSQDSITRQVAVQPLPANTNQNDSIAFIRSIVSHINTAQLRNQHYAFVCDEKMTVDYFFSNKDIVKIVVDFGTVGDVYARESYYYHNGQLVFVHEYVEGGPACEGCITTHQYRTYIKNNKVIRFLKDDSATPCEKKCSLDSNAREYRLLNATSTQAMKKLFCP